MAFDVSKLNDLIEYHDPIIQVVEEESLLREIPSIQVHEGVCPAIHRYTYIIPNITIGDCCEGVESAGEAIEKDFELVCYKVQESFCETDLAKLFRGAGRKLRYTAGREDAGRAGEIIVEANRAAFLLAFNKLLLLGDKTSPDVNLNKIDGWITQARAGGAIEINITTGNIWEALVQIYLQLTASGLSAIYGDRILVFVPFQFGEFYYLQMAANRLIYGDPVRGTIYGLPNVAFIPTHALDGAPADTTYTVFATPERNIIGLVSNIDDEYVHDWKYVLDRQGEYYLWRIKGCIGVGVIDPEVTVVATIAKSVANNPISTVNVNILNEPLLVGTNPAGANGGLLTDTTAGA